jgi:hypothetical protein
VCFFLIIALSWLSRRRDLAPSSVDKSLMDLLSADGGSRRKRGVGNGDTKSVSVKFDKVEAGGAAGKDFNDVRSRLCACGF